MPGLVLSLSSRSSVGVQIGFTLKIGHTAFVFNDGEPVFKGFPAIASGFGSLQDLICNIETPGKDTLAFANQPEGTRFFSKPYENV